MKGLLKSGVHARGLQVVLALTAVLVMALAASAQGKVVWHHGHAYGELPKPGTSSSPSFTGSPFTVGGNQPPLVYNGGPVMLSSKLYVIFWGPAGSFASSYSGPIVQYAKDLATDHAKTTNEFSVSELYYSGSGTHHFITNNVSYGGMVFDTRPYPAIDTDGGCDAADAPCVTDGQIQNEILNEINAKGWPTDPASAPQAHYLVLTPNGTSSCDGPGDCTFSPTNGYCAYHSQVTGISPGNQVATYSNLPYEPGCDSGQAPAGTNGNPDTDGTLDSGIHEIVEAATDPAGTGWLDTNGQEIADKCTNPVVTTQPATYGALLGGLLGTATGYNQVIGGHTYYTQQMWSNHATTTPASTAAAGCVQRIGPSPWFSAPASPHRGVGLAFKGTGSTEVQHPITTYQWNFGDGTTASGASVTHKYSADGTFTVKLTVGDGTTGNASTESRVIKVTG